MCEAPGIRCGRIISLAWLVPSFVCLPELSAPSALFCLSGLKFLYLLGIYSVLQRLLTAFLLGGWGLEEGVNSLWLKWIDTSWATIGMFMGINFLENLQIDSNYSIFLCSFFFFFKLSIFLWHNFISPIQDLLKILIFFFFFGQVRQRRFILFCRHNCNWCVTDMSSEISGVSVWHSPVNQPCYL